MDKFKKYIQDVYTENQLLREIQKDPNKWDNMPCA